MNVQQDGVTALIERPGLEQASLSACGTRSTLTLFVMRAVYEDWKQVQSDVYALDEQDAREKASAWIKTHEKHSSTAVTLHAHPQGCYDVVHQRWWPGRVLK